MPPKSKEADWIRLRHMHDAIKEASSFIRGQSLKELTGDRKLLLALIKDIEILGEAASHISPAFRSQHPEIPWDLIVATRNRLIHGYFNVDAMVVWKTVTEDLPPLQKQLKKLLHQTD